MKINCHWRESGFSLILNIASLMNGHSEGISGAWIEQTQIIAFDLAVREKGRERME